MRGRQNRENLTERNRCVCVQTRRSRLVLLLFNRWFSRVPISFEWKQKKIKTNAHDEITRPVWIWTLEHSSKENRSNSIDHDPYGKKIISNQSRDRTAFLPKEWSSNATTIRSRDVWHESTTTTRESTTTIATHTSARWPIGRRNTRTIGSFLRHLVHRKYFRVTSRDRLTLIWRPLNSESSSARAVCTESLSENST